MKRFGIAVVTAIIASPALAQMPDEATRLVGNQLSEDFVTCSAFYAITARHFGASPRADDKEIGAKFQLESNKSMELAFETSKAIGQKLEVVAVRAEAAAQGMVKEIDGDLINYSLLEGKYLDRCWEITRDPAKTLKIRMGIR